MIRPGWYGDQESERWWDGTAWVDPQAEDMEFEDAVFEFGDPDQPPTRRLRQRWQRVVVWTLVALLLVNLVGGIVLVLVLH